jgi:hypothetical protein
MWKKELKLAKICYFTHCIAIEWLYYEIDMFQNTYDGIIAFFDPQNMGVDTLFVKLSAILTEI